MHTLSNLTKWISQGYTGRGIKNVIALAGYKAPANVTDMYLSGEHPAYIAQAAFVLSCQAGE